MSSDRDSLDGALLQPCGAILRLLPGPRGVLAVSGGHLQRCCWSSVVSVVWSVPSRLAESSWSRVLCVVVSPGYQHNVVHMGRVLPVSGWSSELQPGSDRSPSGIVVGPRWRLRCVPIWLLLKRYRRDWAYMPAVVRPGANLRGWPACAVVHS